MADPTTEAQVDWIHNHLSDWVMWSAIEDDGEHRVDAPVDALAEQLAERDAHVRAEAWDEGYTSGFYDREVMPGEVRDASEGPSENPYREVQR